MAFESIDKKMGLKLNIYFNPEILDVSFLSGIQIQLGHLDYQNEISQLIYSEKLKLKERLFQKEVIY